MENVYDGGAVQDPNEYISKSFRRLVNIVAQMK